MNGRLRRLMVSIGGMPAAAFMVVCALNMPTMLILGLRAATPRTARV